MIPPSESTSQGASDSTPEIKGCRVLLVDDEVSLRILHAEALKRVGFKVETAVDGADAWKALNDQCFDLLITDNRMPRMTGVELIQKIRSADLKLPIILMSGAMPTAELERNPLLKPTAALAKPFTLRELTDTARYVLLESLAQAKATADSILPNRAGTEMGKPGEVFLQGIIPPQRILVVEDNNDIRILSVALLTSHGYEVEGVKDGAAGWAALQAKTYDAVVTDNKMPTMTGLEMIAKLRSAYMRVPVIMATGILPTHEFTAKPWLTPEATLQRPFTNEALLESVKKVLRAQ